MKSKRMRSAITVGLVWCGMIGGFGMSMRGECVDMGNGNFADSRMKESNDVAEKSADVVSNDGVALNAGIESDIRSEAGFGAVADGVSGEGTVGVSEWRIRPGVKASFVFDIVGPVSCSKKVPGQDLGIGGALGGAVRFVHKSGWFAETGLSVAYVSSKTEMLTMRSDETREEWSEGSLRRGRISLPVFAGYIFPLADMLEMNVNTGIEGAYTFAGKVCNGRGTDYTMFGTDGIWRRWNLMYTIGFGFELNELSVEVSGGFGLLNMARENVFHSRTMNESSVSVSLVYWFGN